MSGRWLAEGWDDRGRGHVSHHSAGQPEGLHMVAVTGFPKQPEKPGPVSVLLKPLLASHLLMTHWPKYHIAKLDSRCEETDSTS